MSSKNDVPDFTGQWLCCRQEDMDKLLEINTSGVKGWVAKNAAWATGYGVGKTTISIDQDGANFTVLTNGLSGERTNEFEVGVTKQLEDARVEGLVDVNIQWIGKLYLFHKTVLQNLFLTRYSSYIYIYVYNRH